MEPLVRNGLLYDFYGGLLTEKQQKIMELYYQENWSLAEIAASENVSRQAIHDLVHRSEKTMEEFEAKLGLMAKFLQQQAILSTVTKKLENLLNQTLTTKLDYQALKDLNQQIRQLIESE